MTATIQIEEGKFYTNRDEETFGPMKRAVSQVNDFNWTDREGLRHWKDDGSFLNLHSHYLDLVAEASAPAPEWAKDVEREAAVERFNIEIGRTYRNRCGEKVGPLRATHGPGARLYPFAADTPESGRIFANDGSSFSDIHHDLVAEWVDEPEKLNVSELAANLGLKDPLGIDPVDIKAQIADEAKRIVSGARRSAYGKPEQNFERIARLWQAHFANTGRPEANVTANDISLLMVLMKIGRLAESPQHYDSWVDLVGYGLTGAEVNKVVKSVDGLSPLVHDNEHTA